MEVVSATIDIEDVRSYRAVKSRSMQAAEAERYQRIDAALFRLLEGKLEEKPARKLILTESSSYI